MAWKDGRWFRDDLELVIYKWGLEGQPLLIAELFNADGTPQPWAKPHLEYGLTIEAEGSASPNWDAFYRTGQAVFAEALRRAGDTERRRFAELEAESKRQTAEYEAERKRQAAEISFPDLASQQLYQALYGSWLSTVIGEPKWMTDLRSAEQKRAADEQGRIEKYNAAELARLRDYYVQRDKASGAFTVTTFDNLARAVREAVLAPPPAAAVAPVPVDVTPQIMAAVAVAPAVDPRRAQLQRDEAEAAALRAARLEKELAAKAAKAALEDPARPPKSRLAAAFKYVMALISAGPGER